MKNETIIAMIKATAAKVVKSARASLKPGTYEVDEVVRIKGTITIGEDETQTSKSNVLTEEAFMILGHRLGATREKTLELLTDICQGAMDARVGAKDPKKASKAFLQKELLSFDPELKGYDMINKLATSIARTKKSGKVFWVGEAVEVALPTITEVEAAEIEKTA